MTGRTRRRVLGFSAWIAAACAFALTFAGTGTSVRPAEAQAVDGAAVAQQFLDAYNAGNVDAVLALFVDQGIYIGALPGGPCQLATPCKGREAIQPHITAGSAVHTCFATRAIDVAGSTVVLREELYNDVIRAQGIARILVAVVVNVDGGKISSLIFLDDLADPATARWLAITAGRQPSGTPLPVDPCGSQPVTEGVA